MPIDSAVTAATIGKGWSLPYVQYKQMYLELRPGSQCGHWVTEVFSVRLQGHEGFSGHSLNFKILEIAVNRRTYTS